MSAPNITWVEDTVHALDAAPERGATGEASYTLTVAGMFLARHRPAGAWRWTLGAWAGHRLRRYGGRRSPKDSAHGVSWSAAWSLGTKWT